MDDDRKNLPLTEKKPDENELTPTKRILLIAAALGLLMDVEAYEYYSAHQQEIEAEQRLTDDNGVEYGDYPDRYPALSALHFDKDFYTEIRNASRELFVIFEKVARVFQKAPQKFQEQVNMPPKLIPFEILIEETTTDGDDLGVLFMQRYAEGKFAMFNPPEAIIMQNKSFLALIWQIYLYSDYFSANERKIYENQIDAPDEVVCRDSDKFMYQQFIRTPRFEVQVDSGRLSGFITVSCFMSGAQPSAVYCRFSPNKIIGTEAYYVPLMVN